MKEFFKNFFSVKVGLHVLAMILIFFSVFAVVYFSLDVYTRHGEEVKVPDLKNKSIDFAKKELGKLDLQIVVSDTVYLKNKPKGIVMQQVPEGGRVVKPGRVVYVVINAGESPTKYIPDIIDNSSSREAAARLKSLGFNNIEVQYITGEKDWLYGVKCNGKEINNGDRLSVDSKLIFLVGNGCRDMADSVTYVESPFYFGEDEVEYTTPVRRPTGTGVVTDEYVSEGEEIIDEAPQEMSVDDEINSIVYGNSGSNSPANE